ncbi:MAG: undecaprenyl/decaprenyl-phosphate alpha-N-acetylglucosaminyl 1-phosphate transferase, partial [bacterium]|nr:undecaprenyl/decaprenyl-phosphate alpha-N-acetylglucosaminyl 1-phosphate transferase [bacterium]
MYSVLLTAVVSFGLCLMLTPLVRDLFLRWGVVDRPDGVRKLHSHPIPRVGGIPIAASYLAAYLVLILSPLRGGAWLARELPLVWALIPAAGVVFALGLVDDFRGVRPAIKLAVQVLAALLAYSNGVEIASIAGVEIPAWSSLPLTVIWLVGCANAFNLIDGMDGLATGVGVLATLTIFGAAILQQNTPLALATVPLAGCLLGFLRYNFTPASIFLGDSGSLLVGFLLGCYGVIWSQKSATILGMTAPLMALAVPLMDTALAVVRRFLRGKPIFGADRGHVHHRLLDKGLAPRSVALLLYGACGFAAALSLLTSVV